MVKWLQDRGKKVDAAGAAKKEDGKEEVVVEEKEEEVQGSARKRKTVATPKKEAPKPAVDPERDLPQFPEPEPDSDPYSNESVPAIVAALSLVNTLFLVLLLRFMRGSLMYLAVDVGSNRLPLFTRIMFMLPMATQLITIPLVTQVIMGSLQWFQRRKTITLSPAKILPRLAWYLLLTATGIAIMLETAYFRMSYFDM